MKKKNIISIILWIVGIAGGVLAGVSYFNDIMHPVPFASETWRTELKENIQSISISPLLSVNSIQGLTVNREFKLTSKSTISNFWNEMQGQEESAKNAPGHWTSIKALKIEYKFYNNTNVSFCITFHSKYNVADYYMLEWPQTFYYRPNFASSPKGSKKLYNILMEQVNENNIKWVSNNPDHWRLEPILAYKGE